MNPFLKKLVDQGFMTEGHANYLEAAVMRRESFIISGHKGFGILPLFATLSATAKTNFKIKQVKGFDDLKDDGEYYLIGDIGNVDYAKLVADTMAIPNAAVICLKDPDHPYSVIKVLSDLFKLNGDTSKVYQVIECVKVDGKQMLGKITQMTLNESGKLIKADYKE